MMTLAIPADLLQAITAVSIDFPAVGVTKLQIMQFFPVLAAMNGIQGTHVIGNKLHCQT